MNFTIYLVDSCLLSRMTIQRKMNGGLKIIASYPALREYFEKTKDFFVDIVLFNSDLKSPQDFERCQFLKYKFPKSKLIVYSKTMDKEKLAGLISRGADGFILKNSSPRMFKDVVKSVIDGGFWANYGQEKKIREPNLKICSGEKNIDKIMLTSREMEVLRLLTEGKSNTQIAEEMIVSINTAKAHVGKILNKLSVKDRVQAAVKAVRANMI